MIYVNEIDPYCAQWLQNLMDAGVLPAGHIDTRSIEDVTPNDLAGYTQCHFFAGLGGWIYALDLAGWPRDRPVWTGSCPCQPFSAAGKGAGFADERHLWPAWQHLIAQRKPPTIFGEQVASKAADAWIDLVHADMEGMGYAFGCVPFPAAGVGAPHIRDRSYWVADANHAGLEGRSGLPERAAERIAGAGGVVGGLADDDGRGRMGRHSACEANAKEHGVFAKSSAYGSNRPGPTNGFWRAADWLACTDGKWRPVEPGAQQMVDGLSRGVGLLRSDQVTKEEIANATQTVGLSEQVLRALRNGHAAEAVWGSLGGRIGLPEATLLLAVMCEQSRELGQFFDRSEAGGAPGGEVVVRAVRQGASEAACASPGRGCAEQLTWELGNALPELSQACPSARQYLEQLRQFTGSPLANGVPNRVGRLRAYGNAINPHQAAEFVAAFMNADVRQELAAA